MKKNLLLLLILFLTFSCFAIAPNWHIITGTQFTMILFAQVEHNGTSFTGENGNILAAFGPGGENDCRSIATWNEPSATNPNGFWYLTVVGNINNQQIQFKVYDAQSDDVHSVVQNITFSDGGLIGSPSTPMLLTTSSLYGAIQGDIQLITTTPPAGSLSAINITCNNNMYHPDSAGHFNIYGLPGTYSLVFSLEGYTSKTIQNVNIVQNQTTNVGVIKLVDWSVLEGTQYNMVLMFKININGQEVTDESNYLIGAFNHTNDNCFGIATWQPANQTYWNGFWHMTVVNNNENDTLYIRALNYSNLQIYEMSQSILFQDNTQIGTPQAPFDFYISASQTLDLRPNWNWVSFNVDLSNPTVSSVLAPIQNNIIQVKSQEQTTSFINPPGNWVGDLLDFSLGKGYLINTNASVNGLVIDGDEINQSAAIQLATGWNWVAYYPTQTLPISTALQSILPSVKQVKGQNRSATYYNPPGAWVGDLTTLIPGSCYKVKMNTAATLTYPASSASILCNQDNLNRDIPTWQTICGTQYNMVVMSKILINNQVFQNSPNAVVAAFGPGGESDCRGVAVWVEPSQGNWDGFWYTTVVSNNEDETIHFKVYNPVTDQSYTCNTVVAFTDNASIGLPNQPIILNANVANVDNVVQTLKVDCYPNPFNPTINVRYDLPKTSDVNLSIFNVKGEILCSENISAQYAGLHNFTWNGKDNNQKELSSGIYFIRIQTKYNKITKKVVMMK